MTVEQGANLPASETPMIQTPAPKRPRHPVVRAILFTIREALAILFWVYVVTKLFIFDVDRYLVSLYAPSHIWILNYRALFFLGIAGAIFLLCRRIGTVGSLFYILFYPAVLLFWRMPVALWKQKSWNLTFHFLNGIFAFVRHIRYNIPLVSFYVIALVIVIVTNIRLIVAACDVILLMFLLMIYGHRIYVIFKPDSLFDLYKNLLLHMHEHHATNFKLDENIRDLPVPQLESTQLQKWRSNLEIACVMNWIYKVSAKKLRDYQQSGLPIMSGVVVSMGMLLLTAITFSGIDFGIYKLWPDAFTVTSEPGFFAFFYYAFNGMFFSGVREIVPSIPISQASLMLQYFCSLFLVAIFISLLIAVRQQRHSQELNEVISAIDREGTFIEDIIRTDYHFMTIDDAIAELEKLQSSMLKILLFISRPLR